MIFRLSSNRLQRSGRSKCGGAAAGLKNEERRARLLDVLLEESAARVPPLSLLVSSPYCHGRLPDDLFWDSSALWS